MNSSVNTDQPNTMLVLNIPPEQEEEMVDYLLAQQAVTGFTSYPVRGHGEHSHLSIAEQVSGRRKRMQFEVILPEQSIVQVISGISTEVGKGINYWQLAVSNMGRI